MLFVAQVLNEDNEWCELLISTNYMDVFICVISNIRKQREKYFRIENITRPDEEGNEFAFSYDVYYSTL